MGQPVTAIAYSVALGRGVGVQQDVFSEIGCICMTACRRWSFNDDVFKVTHSSIMGMARSLEVPKQNFSFLKFITYHLQREAGSILSGGLM